MSAAVNQIRCAIYTRKSTEDGLEQEFNSLHAQREACEAYILSQRHEGWELVPDAYDDGGFSGGSMERPGLKALMKAVEKGLVDVIVVYKVDRLTRSLADFAKIVEILDDRKASFVSITQAFNTTTSMGRLTLNVLLSFAQFEREVTGERIRDKIAASKKKGMWMGGPVPLGYIVIERKLVVELNEAERVQTIMRQYLASKFAPALLVKLEQDGMVTKVQHRVSGPHRGGIVFRRGSLFHLLKNPVYRGKIVHKDQIYDGEHEAIVDEELWNAVQAKLTHAAPPRKRSSNSPQDAMLRGLIFDPQARPMVPTYTTRGTRRYRYYETRRDLTGPDEPQATRFAMPKFDKHIIDQLKNLLTDQHALRRRSGSSVGAELQLIFAKATFQKAALADRSGPVVQRLVKKIELESNNLIIHIDQAVLGIMSNNNDVRCWALEAPLPTRKPFSETKLLITDSEEATTKADPKLVALLSEAWRAQQLVIASPELPLQKLAKRENICRKKLTRLLKLSWISPHIVKAIVEGKQPAKLNRTKLLAMDLPIDWNDQEIMLGF